MARLERLSLDDPRWRRFVDGRADATPFHDPEWAILLGECYGLSGFVLAQTDEEGAITAGLPMLAAPRLLGRPRRLVSLPFTDALPPLVDPTRQPSLAEAIDRVRLELGIDRIELRGRLAGARAAAPKAVIHTLPLERDAEAVAAGFASAKRRNARAAARNGLTTRRAEHERDLTELFYGLHLDTRRRLGVPCQPRRFFRLLWQRMIACDRGFVLLVDDGRMPIAAAVFLTRGRTVVYKFGASLTERMRERPNDLLFADAIRVACEEGFATFDFGRTDLSAEGLRRFKAGWGAVARPLVYSAVGEGEPSDASDAAGRVGGLIRRSPAWVARAAGALFYRYAA
jgi:CelD/BcsL family acetyltransferase involved in cellulose biosynthesis